MSPTAHFARMNAVQTEEVGRRDSAKVECMQNFPMLFFILVKSRF